MLGTIISSPNARESACIRNFYGRDLPIRTFYVVGRACHLFILPYAKVTNAGTILSLHFMMGTIDHGKKMAEIQTGMDKQLIPF